MTGSACVDDAPAAGDPGKWFRLTISNTHNRPDLGETGGLSSCAPCFR